MSRKYRLDEILSSIESHIKQYPNDLEVILALIMPKIKKAPKEEKAKETAKFPTNNIEKRNR